MKTSDSLTQHLILKWNPQYRFHRDAPNTIKLHCEILKTFSSGLNDQYVYWGKVSQSGKIGISDKNAKGLNEQILKGLETHLYLYCPDNPTPTLHVGQLIEIGKSDFRNHDHTPHYYHDLKYSIPFWFKLRDIRRLPLSELDNLLEKEGKYFDPVSCNFYPMIVHECDERIFFVEPKHYLIELEGYMMRCFKTGTNCAKQDQIICNPKRVFIGMPFRDKYKNIYKFVIGPTLKEQDFESWIANEIFKNIDIMCKVCEGIQSSKYAIIDVSEWNANVLFELGLLYGLGRDVILLKEENEEVPVDLKGLECISYSFNNFTDLKDKLTKYL
ncbi:MAG: hypothetical protein ABIF11_09960 [Nitrospirota bacterium]